MELLHFSHRRHPLFFRESIPNEDVGDEKACRCRGCGEVISSAYYECSHGCKFFLHKVCAELLEVREHPIHPEHPLTLGFNRDLECNVCENILSDFSYTCYRCSFQMDIVCASLTEREINHESHKHPLTLVRRPALLRCDACGEEHKGLWYQCTTCGNFWIHRDCASLPSPIQRSDHVHPLTLSYSLPSQFTKFNFDCDICRNAMPQNFWVYYCGKCRYFTHVKCAPSKIEPLMSIHPPEIEDHDSNRLYLPPADIKSIKVINFLLKGLGENERATKLNDFNHDHPLILFDGQTEESESCPGKNFKNDDILCEACVKPIFSPFYKCSQCDFFLHKSCAELPTKLQHPLHPPHELILLPKPPLWRGLFSCKGCGIFCNGFAFGCVECEFYLDVNCGSLPSTIKHEAHKDHLLHHLKRETYNRCYACTEWIGFLEPRFRCDTCDIEIHILCSLFPCTLRHRYDEHPLILTYSPVEDREADEYYCEICEEELNPRQWFYHCVDCDQSMHTRCALYDSYSNVNFGGILNVESHRHPLSFVGVVYRNTRCSHCSDSSLSGTFKCTKCDYKLCVNCARPSR